MKDFDIQAPISKGFAMKINSMEHQNELITLTQKMAQSVSNRLGEESHKKIKKFALFFL